MELDLRIVPAREADLERAARLISDAFYVHEMMTLDRISAEQLREELGDTGEMVEAWVGGDLVGTALIRPAADVVRERERPVLVEHSPALYFGLAGVRRDLMRHGVGAAMLTRAEETARERGYPRLLLSALREMGNVDYYLQHGYRVLHHWDFQGEGDEYRFAIMGKELEAPASGEGAAAGD
jgi:GNAT superfamily N-acetyltransferase